MSILSGLDRIQPQGPDEWTPRNVHDDTPDALTLRAALLESDNRAATLLQQQVGSKRVLTVAKEAGLNDLPDVPSLALGTGLVTPLALTAAFAVFPNGGLAVEPRAITRVRDADGSVAFLQAVHAERVLSPEVAFQMVSMLGDVIDRGTGSAARRLGLRGPAGGKTGTTDDFKDAWFVGFSSTLVVGVWVGFDQPETIGREAYGARYALPIWADFMKRAGAGPAVGRVRAAGGAAGRSALRDHLPQAGRRLSALHGVLQGGRRHSRPPVHAAPGHDPAARDAHGAELAERSRPARARHLPLKGRQGDVCGFSSGGSGSHRPPPGPAASRAPLAVARRGSSRRPRCLWGIWRGRREEAARRRSWRRP